MEKNSKPGPPEKPINWNTVERMIEGKCSQKNICKKLDIDKSTFIRRFKQKYGQDFTTYATENHSNGAENIQLTQYMRALNGNTALLILLGKEWCGQGRNQETTPTVPNEEFLILVDKLAKAEYRINQLENAIQPKTESSLQRSDSSV
jgi:hypothetical protein